MENKIHFAPHYKPVESTPQLESGCYEAKITSAEFKTTSWGETQIKCTVEITNHLGAKPNTFTLRNEPTKDNPNFPLKDQIESYNREMTRFFDEFGITRGDFNLENFIGKVGIVTVHPQANASGYNEITPFKLSDRELKNRIKKAEEKSKEAEENKKAMQNAPQVPQFNPLQQNPVQPQMFTEDMPY